MAAELDPSPQPGDVRGHVLQQVPRIAEAAASSEVARRQPRSGTTWLGTVRTGRDVACRTSPGRARHTGNHRGQDADAIRPVPGPTRGAAPDACPAGGNLAVFRATAAADPVVVRS